MKIYGKWILDLLPICLIKSTSLHTCLKRLFTETNDQNTFLLSNFMQKWNLKSFLITRSRTSLAVGRVVLGRIGRGRVDRSLVWNIRIKLAGKNRVKSNVGLIRQSSSSSVWSAKFGFDWSAKLWTWLDSSPFVKCKHYL